MPQAIAYADVPGLDLAAERKIIDFPVSRETQFSETRQFVSGFSRISVPDPSSAGKFIPVGEVPVTRPHLPYGETMDWIVKEFEEIGIPFKLRVSAIDRRNFNLYQEYIFDQAVAPPDGEGISPMVLVHGSYVKGSPLVLYLGTYRFVCSNGAIVSAGGKTHLSVNTRNWGNLQSQGFHDDFRAALDHYSDVGAFYARLNDVPFSETAEEIFKPKLIPFCMRKKVIGQLEEDGAVSLNIESDNQDGERYKSIKEEDFSTPGLIAVNGDISTWDVYNRFTSIGSRLSSTNRVLIAGKSIDRVFQRLKRAA
ncbi:MAG: DUF945 domain-containing protein [Spirochaetaceae bacterium]|jgi:hypothetical protein|nr:DUF945 domain-containing protein [Spirochaetaceae bacterium]